jgi:hypothetical protein
MYETSFIKSERHDEYNILTFAIPYLYELNDKLKKLTPEMFAKVLQISTNMLETVETYSNNKSYIDYKEFLEKELKVKEVLYNNRERGLKETIEGYEGRIEEYETIVEKSVEMSLKTVTRTYEGQIEQLKRSNEMLKNMYDSLLTSNKDVIERVEMSKNNYIKTLETSLNNVTSKMKTLEERYEKTVTSSMKGMSGETSFMELIHKHTNWMNVEDTSKTAHSGDMRCNIGEVCTLIEVKNYGKDVPTKEISKFLRDMEENPTIPYGIFASLTTGITGKKEDISMEWTNQGQLCVFMGKFLDNDVEMSMKMLGQLAFLGNRIYTIHHKCGESDLGMYKDKLGQIKYIISNHIVDINQLMLMIGHDRKILIETLTKQGAMYKVNLEKMKVSVENIMDIIMGGHVDMGGNVIGPLDELFRKKAEDSSIDVVIEPEKSESEKTEPEKTPVKKARKKAGTNSSMP